MNPSHPTKIDRRTTYRERIRDTGRQFVEINLDRSLLAQIDHMKVKLGLTRSQALEKVLRFSLNHHQEA